MLLLLWLAYAVMTFEKAKGQGHDAVAAAAADRCVFRATLFIDDELSLYSCFFLFVLFFFVAYVTFTGQYWLRQYNYDDKSDKTITEWV